MNLGSCTQSRPLHKVVPATNQAGHDLRKAEDFLQKIGANDRDIYKLTPFILREGFEKAVLSFAALKAAGVSWETMHQTLKHTEAETASPHRLNRIFSHPQNMFSISSPEKSLQSTAITLRHPETQARIKLFEVDFHSIPVHLAPGGNKTPGRKIILGMFLHESEKERFAEKRIELGSSHIHDSFAFATGYIADDNLVITEIQSDQYGAISQRGLKERYKHWSAQLLLGVTEYGNYLSSLPGGPKQIMIADSTYQKLRWPEPDESDISGKGINPVLNQRIYEQLPERLGFQHIKNESVVSFEKNCSGKKVPLKNAWVKDLGRELPVQDRELLSEFRNTFTPEISNRFLDNLTRFVKAANLATHRLNDPLSDLITEQDQGQITAPLRLNSGMTTVPAEQIPFSHIDGITPEMLHTQKILLDNFPHQTFAEAIPVNSAQISKGNDQGVSDSLEETAAKADHNWSATPVHFKYQARHPKLLLQRKQNNITARLSIGIKGGGICNQEEEYEGYEDYQFRRAEERLPIMLNITEGSRVVESHNFWGGLSRTHGEIEALNSLAAHQLMFTVDEGDMASAPFPLDLHKLTHLPFWNQGKEHIIEMDNYRKAFLDNSSEELVTLRSISECDLRVAQVMNTLFNSSASTKELEKTILAQLEIVYHVHGHEFHPPQAQFPDTPEIELDILLNYLRNIYLENQEAADSILDTIESRTLKTIAAVHGAGGHLGGTFTEYMDGPRDEILYLEGGIGAVKGGPTALRNMSISGVMYDWDTTIYLPWVYRSDLDSVQRGYNESLVEGFQYQDLAHWEGSIYWLRNMLQGRELKPGFTLISDPFRNTFDSGPLLVDPSEFDYDAEQERALLYKRRKDQTETFCESGHAALYEDYSQRGADFRNSL